MNTLPSIGSYIDESWLLYKNYFGSYARITIWYAVAVVVGIVAGLFLPTYGNLPFVDNVNALYGPKEIAGLVVSSINLLLILPLISLWVSVGLVKFMKRVTEGAKADTAEIMNDAGRSLLPAVGITILLTLIFTASFLIPWIPGMIFVIFGMNTGGAIGLIGIVLLTIGIIAGMALLAYYAIRYSFAFYEVVIGNATITSSLSRSYDMTAGKFWAIFWRWLVSGCILVIIGTALNLLTYLLGTTFVNLFLSNLELFERLAVSLDLVLSLVVFMLITPLSGAFSYVLYRHISRK